MLEERAQVGAQGCEALATMADLVAQKQHLPRRASAIPASHDGNSKSLGVRRWVVDDPAQWASGTSAGHVSRFHESMSQEAFLVVGHANSSR
jgi:hypothetical protein